MEFPSDIRRKKEFLIRKSRVSKVPKASAQSQDAGAKRTLSFEQGFHDDRRGNTTSFYRRGIASSDFGHSQPSISNDPLPDELASMYWPPGRTIPITRDSEHISSPESEFRGSRYSGSECVESERASSSTITDILRNFQTSMEKKLVGIEDKLGSIGARIDKVETQQCAMEKKLSTAISSQATPTSSSSKVTPNRRNKVTPTSLQSKIRQVHAVLSESNQIKTAEAINSAHNTKVVQEIVATIGTDTFEEDQIRKGCRTYRKTLVAKNKDVSTPVKRKKQERSRKQRSYERRGRAVKAGKEAKLWAEVTPDMMSDEEQDGDVYVRHPPSYRSSALRRFIEKLDSRLEAENGNSFTHPRVERRLGSPRQKAAPSLAVKWTVAKKSFNQSGENAESATQEDEECSSEEESSEMGSGQSDLEQLQ